MVVIGGALTDGGSIIDWFSRVFDCNPWECLSQCPHPWEEQPGVYSPTSYNNKIPCVLPFWSGERSTGYHNAAVGTITGITLHTSRIQLLQGIVESINYRLVEIVSLILQWYPGPSPGGYIWIASGGVLDGNSYWCQSIAMLSECPVLQLDSSLYGEATSRGVALYMWRSILSTSPSSSSPSPTTYNPTYNPPYNDSIDYLYMLKHVYMCNGIDMKYVHEVKNRYQYHQKLYTSFL